MQDTTLCFTISIHATGAMATIASLLMCAHGRMQPTMLSFPAIDPYGNYYTAIVTSMDFEKWLQEEHFQRRTKQYKLYQKQVAAGVREGRVRITILHPQVGHFSPMKRPPLWLPGSLGTIQAQC